MNLKEIIHSKIIELGINVIVEPTASIRGINGLADKIVIVRLINR